ncbi:MAG TPA: hypothetical protein VFA10_18305 [Ktedonobacteraceae bacterium]|nr:hypothetical protein [Ktedonobacteraceae bacterium]
MAFRPDGRQFGFTVADSCTAIWNLDIPLWPEQACSIANRNFTTEEWNQLFTEQPYQKVCAHLPGDAP